MKMLKMILGLLGVLALSGPFVHGFTAQQANSDRLQAYVLQDQSGNVMGNSGVRIGPLDLGMNTQRQLQKYGLSQSLIDRFSPFIGLTGTKAAQALQANPFQVSQDEMNLIEQKFKTYWKPKFDSAPRWIRSNPDAQEVYRLAEKNDWVPFLEKVDQLKEELTSQ